MKKLFILVTMLIVALAAAGCAGISTGKQTIELGSLILNQMQIDTADVIKEPAAQYTEKTLGPADIAQLISMVSGITVTRLSAQQDNDFMPSRILEDHLTVRFCSHEDYAEKLQGEFFIWPDGQIYAVEPNSMQGASRTIAYLSEANHPGIYEWLTDKAVPYDVPAAQSGAAAQFVRDQGYTILVNSGAGFYLQMPGSFDEKINGVNVGALLKKANEQSKLYGLDFSGYLGKEVVLVTYGGEKQGGAVVNLDLIMDGAKIIGFWVDQGGVPPDFNLIVNASQPNFDNPKQLLGYLQDYDPQTRVLRFDEIEWVAQTDAARIKELGLNAEQDFPNGYYIYNPSPRIVSMKVAHLVKVYLVNWNDLATPSVTDINGLQRRMAEYPAPYHLKYRDGVIYEISEQYRP